MKQESKQTKQRLHPMIDVTVHEDMDEVREIWCAFQHTAVCGPHDTWEWNDAWACTAGHKDAPLIAVGRNNAGEVVLLLPLTIRSRSGCRILEWLGSEQGNYSSGLYHPTAWQDPEMPRDEALLKCVLAELPRIDAVHLDKQPEKIAGYSSPLQGLPGVPEASPGHSFPIGENWESFFNEQFSSNARSKMRRNERRLADEGEITYEIIRSTDEKTTVIDEVIAQKSTYFSECGIHDFLRDAGIREFLHVLSRLPEDNRALSTRHMVCRRDGELVAAKFGVVHNDTYYGLIASTTNDPIRRHGPGNVLFKYSVIFLSDEGLMVLDCGAGEDETKLRWCTEERTRLHSIVPVTPRGYVYAAILTVSLKAKLFIKNNPQIWARYKQVRKTLACYLKPKASGCEQQSTAGARVEA